MNPRKAAVLFLLAASPCASRAGEIPWGSDTQLTQWGELDITEPSGRDVKLYFWRDKYKESGGPIAFYVFERLPETSQRSMERPPTDLEDLGWVASNSGPRGALPVPPRPTYYKNVTVRHYRARVYQARCSVDRVQVVNDTTANIYGEIQWDGTEEAGGWGLYHRRKPALADDWIRVHEPARGPEGLVVPETSPFSQFKEFRPTSPTFAGIFRGPRTGNVIVASHFTALEILLGNGHNTSARVWLAPDEISAAAAERRYGDVNAFVLRARPQMLDDIKTLYDHLQANLAADLNVFTGKEQRLLGDMIHNGDDFYEADHSDAYKDYYFGVKKVSERLDEDNGYRWIETDFMKELQAGLDPAQRRQAFVRKYRLYLLSELYLAARAAQPLRETSAEIPLSELKDQCKAQKRRIALTAAGEPTQLADNERQAGLPWPGAVASLNTPLAVETETSTNNPNSLPINPEDATEFPQSVRERTRKR